MRFALLALLLVASPAHAGRPAGFQLAADTSYDYAVASDAALQVAAIGGAARYEPRHNYYLGDPILELDGSLGWATANRLAYSAALRFGTEGRMTFGELVNACDPCAWHRAGILTGVRVDGIADRIAAALTVPLDAYWYRQMSEHGWWLGAIGGVHVAVAGADRRLGWSGGLGVIVRDIHVTFAVEQRADATFAGVALTLTTTDRYDRSSGIPL